MAAGCRPLACRPLDVGRFHFTAAAVGRSMSAAVLQRNAPMGHRSFVNRDCCSPFPSASAAARCWFTSASAALPRFQQLPDCVRLGCCSPIASASTAAPRCVRFGCCSPIASASTAAPRLHPLVASPVLEDSSPCLMFSNILCGVRGSVN